MADLEKKMIVIKRLENEMRTIRRQIDAEANPVRKAEMLNVYGKMSQTLNVKQM